MHKLQLDDAEVMRIALQQEIAGSWDCLDRSEA